MATFSIALICLSVVFALVDAVVQQPCTGSDCHPFYMTQGSCKEITSPPAHDCRWTAGLNPYTDRVILNGTIIAFQLQWFGGGWSPWFVTGVNDIGPKFIANPASCFPSADAAAAGQKSLMRWWAYFTDHNHKYIICYNS